MARKSSKDKLNAGEKAKGKNTNGADNGEAPPAMGGNVTDETRLTQMEGILAAHKDLVKAQQAVSQANGVYRNKIKVAAKLGLNKAAILEVVRLQTVEPGDEVSKVKETIRLARLMGMPIGSQLSFLEDIAAAAEVLPYNAGRGAAENREPSDNNPHEPGTEEHQDWARGYQDRLVTMLPNQMPAEAHA